MVARSKVTRTAILGSLQAGIFSLDASVLYEAASSTMYFSFSGRFSGTEGISIKDYKIGNI